MWKLILQLSFGEDNSADPAELPQLSWSCAVVFTESRSGCPSGLDSTIQQTCLDQLLWIRPLYLFWLLSFLPISSFVECSLLWLSRTWSSGTGQGTMTELSSFSAICTNKQHAWNIYPLSYISALCPSATASPHPIILKHLLVHILL